MDREDRAPGMAAGEKRCSSCGSPLQCVRERVTLGGDGWGFWTAMFAENMTAAVYICPQCGKLEFYSVQEGGTAEPASLEDLESAMNRARRPFQPQREEKPREGERDPWGQDDVKAQRKKEKKPPWEG